MQFWSVGLVFVHFFFAFARRRLFWMLLLSFPGLSHLNYMGTGQQQHQCAEQRICIRTSCTGHPAWHQYNFKDAEAGVKKSVLIWKMLKRSARLAIHRSALFGQHTVGPVLFTRGLSFFSALGGISWPSKSERSMIRQSSIHYYPGSSLSSF